MALFFLLWELELLGMKLTEKLLSRTAPHALQQLTVVQSTNQTRGKTLNSSSSVLQSFLLAHRVTGYIHNISVRILFHQWLRATHGPAEAILAIKPWKSSATQWCCFRGCPHFPQLCPGSRARSRALSPGAGPAWCTLFNTSTLNKNKTRIHLQL